MKLLIVTQVLDVQDSNLGFFHRWIEEFAAHCEQVIVICLRKGEYLLPENVTVLSLGKEVGTSKFTRAVRFWKYIYRYRNDYDAVFVHMNPEYIILGAHLWRRWGKKIGLWYAHKSVTRKLSYAVKLVDRVFSSSAEGFRIRTPKLDIVGQGIDTDLFKPEIHLESTEIRILTVGRIAESKHLLEMLEVLDVLHARGENFLFTIVGSATTPVEEQYARRLEKEITKRPYKDKVHMQGSVPHHDLPKVFHAHDVLFNFSTTGSMDKAVLEALATGIFALTANEAYKTLLTSYGLYVPGIEASAAADALLKFLSRPDRPSIAATLRNRVVAEHSLSSLIPKILKELA